MADQAKVLSTDALEAFRSSLILFVAKARRSLDSATDEVRQTRTWLQHDQRIHWEGEIRRCSRRLDQAEQELSAARFSGKSESALMTHRATVRKARQELEEIENKLQQVKRWNQGYDNRVAPMVKKLEGLHQTLDSDLPHAMAYLAQARDKLEHYVQTPAPAPEATP